MDVHPIQVPAFVHDPWRRHLSGLITTFGTPKFESLLFQLLDEALCCEHLTAFAVPQSGQPRLMLAANRGDSQIARIAGRNYLQYHWHADPTNRVLAKPHDLMSGVITSVSPEEMERLQYRRACYSRGDWESSGALLVHKITVIKRHAEEVLKVSLYRHRDAGPFGECDLQRIAEFSDLLIAFLARHAPPQPTTDPGLLRERFEKCLTAPRYGLTRREVQVCAAIAVGMSSEAIALTLDVRLNTVLTFRKRAYARLGICSQNELLRLLYTNLHLA